MSAASAGDWVSFGHIAKAHGIKGGVRLHLWNEATETLRPGLVVQLRAPGQPPRDTTVAAVYGPGLVRLEGVVDRNAAEPLRGAEVFIRRADFPPPDEGERYLIDLIGAVVVDEQGAVLGTLAGFVEETAQPLAEIAVPGRAEPVLVPFVPPIVVRVEDDAAPIRVVLAPPLGLFDLEQAL